MKDALTAWDHVRREAAATTVLRDRGRPGLQLTSFDSMIERLGASSRVATPVIVRARAEKAPPAPCQRGRALVQLLLRTSVAITGQRYRLLTVMVAARRWAYQPTRRSLRIAASTLSSHGAFSPSVFNSLVHSSCVSSHSRIWSQIAWMVMMRKHHRSFVGSRSGDQIRHKTTTKKTCRVMRLPMELQVKPDALRKSGGVAARGCSTWTTGFTVPIQVRMA